MKPQTASAPLDGSRAGDWPGRWGERRGRGRRRGDVGAAELVETEPSCRPGRRSAPPSSPADLAPWRATAVVVEIADVLGVGHSEAEADRGVLDLVGRELLGDVAAQSGVLRSRASIWTESAGVALSPRLRTLRATIPASRVPSTPIQARPRVSRTTGPSRAARAWRTAARPAAIGIAAAPAPAPAAIERER